MDGPTVSKQAFGTALAGKLSGLILSPTDFSSASFLLGGEDGSLEFNDLATLGIAKELFVLSPLFDPTPAETGLAIRQLRRRHCEWGGGDCHQLAECRRRR